MLLNVMLQRWGNLTQLSQSILGYILILINIFVFCWFGSLLSEQESTVMPNWVTQFINQNILCIFLKYEPKIPTEFTEI